jgi:hypothetical protein
MENGEWSIIYALPATDHRRYKKRERRHHEHIKGTYNHKDIGM